MKRLQGRENTQHLFKKNNKQQSGRGAGPSTYTPIRTRGQWAEDLHRCFWKTHSCSRQTATLHPEGRGHTARSVPGGCECPKRVQTPRAAKPRPRTAAETPARTARAWAPLPGLPRALTPSGRVPRSASPWVCYVSQAAPCPPPGPLTSQFAPGQAAGPPCPHVQVRTPLSRNPPSAAQPAFVERLHEHTKKGLWLDTVASDGDTAAEPAKLQ